MHNNPRRSAFMTLLWLAALCLGSCCESSAQPAPANVAVAAPGRIEHSGNVMQIGTAASGTVGELLVQEGARVESGQPLVRIDCTSLQKELNARASTLAAFEAALAGMVQGPRPEEIAIGVANAALAEARAEEASVALQRALSWGEGITTTEAQIDQTKRDARIAAAQLDEARARLALLRAGSRREDILEAQSKRDAANALVEETAARLDHCSVRAPAGGTVLSIGVTPGQFISSSAPMTLLKLTGDGKRRVRAEVDGRDLAKICMRQPATVTSESFPGVQIGAVTERINEAMTRPTISSGDPAERRDRDAREVLLSLNEDTSNWPIGLRVSVKFGNCPPGQGGPGR
jgi:multidrug resistance efflux pump